MTDTDTTTGPATEGTPAAHPPPSTSAAPDGAAPVDGGTPDADPATFPLEYVQQLRSEAATNRVKAKEVDTLRGEVLRLVVDSTGRLADPTDLPMDAGLFGEDGRPDVEKVNQAVEDLLARKPHLAARRVSGDVGQGARSAAAGTPSLGQVLSGARRNA